MTERPILFNTPMVRALLDGRKTQTRRVVKCHVEDYGGILHTKTVCPYGQPGDRLWVREAWARTSVFPGAEMVVYREGDNRTDYGGPWKPGIHMFRRDSRITLEITGVRVERLRDISEPDCKAEGAKGGNGSIPGYHYSATPHEHYRHIWESINGTGSWDANPWVWVVEFKTKGTV